MRKPVVAIVDDDPVMRKGLAGLFAEEGFDALEAASASELLDLLAGSKIDAVLLDLMLPEGNAINALGRIREFNDPAILITSVRGSILDKVVGLEMGADDYMVKPVDGREALARCRAVLRRRDRVTGPSHVRCFNGWAFDMVSRLLTDSNGQEVRLTGREFDVLAALTAKAGQVVSREELMAVVGGEWSQDGRALDMVVARLRRKLNDPADDPRIILTIHGEGYLFGRQVT